MEFIGIIMMVGLIILPAILLVVGFCSGIPRASRLPPSIRPFLLYPLMCSFLLTGGFAIWQFNTISTSRSSTAAIGYFFLPAFAFAVAVITFVVSWAVFYVGWFIYRRIQGDPVRLISVALFILAIVLLVWTGYVGQTKITRHRLLNEAKLGHSVARLETILKDGVSSHDFEVLANLAKNPNTSTDELIRLFNYCKPHITEFNPPEYSILFSLAHNKNTSTQHPHRSCRLSPINDSICGGYKSQYADTNALQVG